MSPKLAVMPRQARLALDGVSVHIIQRGVDRGACFFTDDDRYFYLDQLAKAAAAHACALHAYVLMSNHVHLLMTPTHGQSLGKVMKQLNERYVQAINRTHQRTGPLWEGRFRSCLVDSEAYLLACYRYIELNPVRAGLVSHPQAYPWSSHRANATGMPGRPLTAHERFLALGPEPGTRGGSYRALIADAMENKTIDAIRIATRAGRALGGTRFQNELAAALGRRVTLGKAGRPGRLQGDQSG